MKLLLVLWVLLFSLLTFVNEDKVYAQPSTAETGTEPVGPYVAPRELLVVKSGLDQVFGTSVVAVIYRGKDPIEFSFPLNLPRETVDFQASEGLEAKDILLTPEGIVVKKVFSPGVQVVSVSFALPANNGSSRLTLVPQRDLPELILMTPRGLLEVTSPHMVSQGFDKQDNQVYQVYGNSTPLVKGQPTVLELKDIPQGRSNLWRLGLGFAVILGCGAIFFTWKTREINLEERKHG